MVIKFFIVIIWEIGSEDPKIKFIQPSVKMFILKQKFLAQLTGKI